MASAKKQAVSQPQFIIKSNDGTFYLTVSLWAYDPNAPAPSNQLAAQATQTIVNKFNTLLATPANVVQAVQVPNAEPIAYMAMIT
jgi:hypothetical protein